MTLDLRTLGLNLIPCLPKDKRPAVAWKEYQTKKYDKPIPPEMNRAVICGQTSDNLVVIDVDSPEVINDLFNDFEGLKTKTLVVKTGSGGFHIYVRPKGNMPSTQRLTNEKGQHIDIQCNGTYVVAPGSIHPNGNPYELISSTTEIEHVDLDIILKHLVSLGFITSKQINIEDIAKGGLVKGAKIRNDALFRLTLHLMQTVKLDEETAWHEIQRWNSTNIPPIPAGELQATFKSAAKRVIPTPIEEINKIATFPNFKKIREVSAKDEGKIVSFDAVVLAMDEYRTVTTLLTAQCPNCLREREIESDGYVNPKLPKCEKCKVNLQEKSIMETTDMRQIILQELPEECVDNAPINRNARVIGDDAFNVNFGDRIRVSGQFKSFTETGRRDNQVAILINQFQCLDEPDDLVLSMEELQQIKSVVNDDFIKEKLIPSFAPGLFGLEVQKEILLLTLAGGCKVGGIRPDINTFIVGNPSGGKSEMLKFFNNIATKCSFVNAATSSAAGLVYGMVKLSDGTSVPQAGPVVQNDGGFCCIDELDKAREGVYSSLLEAMEQQSVSFARSGVNRTANARTAIISAANPEGGKWDTESTFMENIKIPQPLASRFDWITGIIKSNNIQRGMIADHVFNKSINPLKPYFTEIQLKKFFNYIKNLEPKISQEAQNKLREFYMKISVKLEGEGIPFEVRQLEGLQRACFARAKILMKDEVSVKDVDVIIELYKRSLETLNLTVSDTEIQSQFEDSGTKKKSKEKTLRNTFISLEDENGLVDKTELCKKLISEHPNNFSDAFEFDEFFKKYEGSTFLLDGNTGKYKFRL